MFACNKDGPASDEKKPRQEGRKIRRGKEVVAGALITDIDIEKCKDEEERGDVELWSRQVLLRSGNSKPFGVPNRLLLFYRNASLGSAIYKGIRRSSIPERVVRSRGGNGVRGERVDRSGVVSNGPSRPSHALGLDVGEVEEKPRRPGSKIRNRPSWSQDFDRRQGASGYSNGKSLVRGQATSPKHTKGTGRYGSSRFPFKGRASEPNGEERTGGYSRDMLSLQDRPRRSGDVGGSGRHGDCRTSFPSRSFVSDRRDRRAGTEETSRRSSYGDHRSGSGNPGYEGTVQKPSYSQKSPFAEGRDHTIHPRDQAAYSSHNQSRSDLRRSETSLRPPEKSPLSIPYTTASSEFLYGTSVVMAALRSKRRQMHKLYVQEGELREAFTRDADVRGLAREAGVDVIGVPSDWTRLMDKMSSGRPHNGYILEASPLPKLPVVSVLEVPEKTGGSFQATLSHQSKEDQAVNGTSDKIPWKNDGWRYPLVLLLDGILDPGNLGNTLRSAYFLGVDAVAISTRNSAPLSPIALKASAGASEYIPILSITHPGHFIDASTKNGWRFYAAVAPPKQAQTQTLTPNASPYLSTSSLHASPLANHPCVLILGGEGEGLRQALRRKVGYEVAIEGRRAGIGGVDSLNVSVAAGMLCEMFLRKPRGVSKREENEGKLF